MSQQKRVIGYDQDYPGSYRWPIHEIKCPVCKLWKKEYGEVDQEIDGEWQQLCIECGEKAWAEEIAQGNVFTTF
jgi:hypothetical protein